MKLAEALEQAKVLETVLGPKVTQYYDGSTRGYVLVHEKDGRRIEFVKVKEVTALSKPAKRKRVK